MIDLVDMKAFRAGAPAAARRPPRASRRSRSPSEQAELAQEYREKLMDEVCEVSDSLMERYLEGEEISHEEIVDALKEGTNHGKIFPVVCGCATRNLGTSRLLDAIVEDLPSPVKHGVAAGRRARAASRPRTASCSRTCSRPAPTRSPGRINLLRVYQGVLRADSQVLNTRAHVKERIGQLLRVRRQGGRATCSEFGPGDIGAVAKLKETRAGDWLADRDEPIEMPRLKLPAPGDGLRRRAQEPRRRGQGALLAAPAAGGGPDDRPAPRPADRRADRRRASRRCTWK